MPEAPIPQAPEKPVSFTQEYAAAHGGAPPPVADPGQAAQPSWSDYAQEVGFNTEGYEDQKSFYQALADNHRQLSEQARYGQEIQAVAPEFQEFLANRGKQQAPAEQPKPADQEWSVDGHFQKLWEKPQRDPSWQQMVDMGWIAFEDGQYVPKSPYAPAAAIAGLNGERLWQRDSLQKLLDNPYKLIHEGMKEPLDRRVRELIQEAFGGHQQKQALDSFEHQHADLLFQKTGDGADFAVDPGTGRLVTSFFGARFYQHVGSLQQHIKDPMQAANMAYQIAAADTICAHYQQQQQAAQAQQSQQAQPPNGQQPQQPSSQANGAPPRAPNGQFLPQKEQPKEASFLENAIARASHSPSGGSSSSAADPPTVNHRSEMAGLFSNPARARGLT